MTCVFFQDTMFIFNDLCFSSKKCVNFQLSILEMVPNDLKDGQKHCLKIVKDSQDSTCPPRLHQES